MSISTALIIILVTSFGLGAVAYHVGYSRGQFDEMVKHALIPPQNTEPQYSRYRESDYRG